MLNSLPRRRLRPLPFLLFLPIALVLSACASNPQPAEIAVAPKPAVNPYRYITWSSADTADTINQIRRHNARHARMLAGK